MVPSPGILTLEPSLQGMGRLAWLVVEAAVAGRDDSQRQTGPSAQRWGSLRQDNRSTGFAFRETEALSLTG